MLWRLRGGAVHLVIGTRLPARGRFAAVLAAVMAAASLVAASPASARLSQIQMSPSGSAVAAGCPDGAPCTERVTYDGQTSGTTPSPFSDFPYYDQPIRLIGFLEFPNAGSGDCGSGVNGVFQVLAARGGSPKERVAFEVVVSEATATCGPWGHSLTAAFVVDSTNTEDPAFRNAVGSGEMQLQDAPGVFQANLDGIIEFAH